MLFNMYVIPAPESGADSMTGLEYCGWESSTYLEDFRNWQNPIIITPTGCPSINFVPPTFGDAAVSWLCAS